MSKYLSWHNHCNVGSLRDSLSPVKELVNRCKENDMAFAITDHGSISAWIEIYNQCKKAGVKPILGNEIYIHQNRKRLFELRDLLLDKELDADTKRELEIEKEEVGRYNHLVVVTKNQHGFQNLIDLSNQAYVNGYYRFPLNSYEELINLPKKDGSRGLLISSACLGSPLSQFIISEKFEDAENWIKFMQETFGSDFYLEVQAVNMDIQRTVNEKIMEYSKKFGISAILANDSHYPTDEYSKAHERFLLLQGEQKVSDIGKKQWRITYEDVKTGKRKRKKVDLEGEFKKGLLASDLVEGETYAKEKIFKKELVDKVWLIEADDLSFKTEAEIRTKVKKEHPELKKELENLIKTNYSLYDQIDEIQIDTTNKLPKFDNSNEELLRRVTAGIKKHGIMSKLNKAEYLKRVNEELSVINKNGFNEYFIILADLFEYIHENKIARGCGRGSSVGSLIAMLLDITMIDPLEWGLPFERFLSAEMGGAVSFPDIDSDLYALPTQNFDAREFIITYLAKKYGSDHIAYIGNRLIYKLKSAIRDISQVYEIPSNEMFKCSKAISDEFSLDVNIRRYKEVKEFFTTYPELKKLVEQITGTTSALGVHAGGVIISDKQYPLSRNVGLQRQSGALNATCWTKDEIAQLGYIKYDFLGLKAAGQIHLCKTLTGHDPYTLYQFNLEDVFANTVLKGNNSNVFQFESNLGKKCFTELLPVSIDDLSNASGLIRVLGSEEGRQMYDSYKENVIDLQTNPNSDPMWEERLRDEVTDEETFQICRKVLEKTYGILIYQEQLSFLVRDISRGKHTFVDGNNVRKMLGKLLKNHGHLQDLQGSRETMKAWHTDFMKVFDVYFRPFLPDSIYTKQDIDFLDFNLDDDNRLRVPMKGIVSWLVMCSVYIFSRLHSIAYSINTYEQLYQKYYHPKEFWLSVLICDYNSADDIRDTLAAIRGETSIQVLPPDINLSDFFFKLEGDNIRFGLGSIMSLGKSAEAIVEIREQGGAFTSLEDFLKRIKGHRSITSKTIKNLLFVGAFNMFGTEKELFAYFEKNEVKMINFEPEEKTFNIREQSGMENKLIGCNITYLDPIMKKAKQYTPLHELPDKFATFMAVKIVKNLKKKTKTGKDYIMNSVVDLNSNKAFNVFNWDMKEYGESQCAIMKVYKNGDFISVAK
jgi:DNA polymerase-3 subunit alpha